MTLRRALFAWLAFAVLAAQSLAFVHRVVHAPLGHSTAKSSSWSASLFSHHDDEGACRLFDAVGHGAAPAQALVILPLALPSFVLAQREGECLTRFSALFAARGPPPVR